MPNWNDYQQKLLLSMSSGDLPDIFWVNDLSVLSQLAEASMDDSANWVA